MGQDKVKLKGAVVGCGMIAEYHLLGWRRIPEVEIVALVDPNLAQARLRRDALVPAARVFASLQEAFASAEIDFVDILTPPQSHSELCLEAAARKAHVACQKPLCQSPEEAEDLVYRLRHYSKQFCVHENHPWRPWFREIRKRYLDGLFGESLELRISQHEPVEPPEEFKTRSEKGIMLDYGIHLVAMAQALFGEPSHVKANFERINPRVVGESRASVSLEFPMATAQIDVSWQDHGAFEGGFLLKGSRAEARLEGTLTRGESSRFLLIENGKAIQDEIRSPSLDYSQSFYLWQKAFVDAILRGSDPPEPAHSNLKTLRTTFAAYAAAKVKDPA